MKGKDVGVIAVQKLNSKFVNVRGMNKIHAQAFSDSKA
jgi:hypothetical protein